MGCFGSSLVFTVWRLTLSFNKLHIFFTVFRFRAWQTTLEVEWGFLWTMLSCGLIYGMALSCGNILWIYYRKKYIAVYFFSHTVKSKWNKNIRLYIFFFTYCTMMWHFFSIVYNYLKKKQTAVYKLRYIKILIFFMASFHSLRFITAMQLNVSHNNSSHYAIHLIIVLFVSIN